MDPKDRPRPGTIEQRVAPQLLVDGKRLRGRIPYGVESRDMGGWREVIDPSALNGAKLDDLVATVDHGGVPIGRHPGTLELEDRTDGLHWAVQPPESRADVREAVERGDLKASSWRMVVGKDRWEGDVRHVEQISELRDVSLVTHPAYPEARAEYRSQDGQDGRYGPAPAESDRGGGLTVQSRNIRPEAQRGETRQDPALRTIERYVQSGELRSAAADNLDQLVRRRDPTGIDSEYLAAVGDPAYNTGFGKLLRYGEAGARNRFTDEEARAFQRTAQVEEQRAHMAEGVGPTGGYGVPFTLDPTIMLTSAGHLNPIREVASVITIGTREWKGVSSAGVTASYDAEAAEVSDDSPTLAQPTIVSAMGRAFVPFSIEVGMDWSGLQTELARLIADARDVLDATMFLTGTGTDQPAGLLTGLAVGQRVQCAAAGFPAVVDHYSLKGAVPARFLPNLTWAAHPSQWDRTYRLTPAGSATEPQMLVAREGPMLGRPKVEWTAMANAQVAGNKLIIAGDFRSGFRIADRLGLTVEVVQHLLGAAARLPTGERGLFAYWRTGSKTIVPEALRYLETV